VLSGDQPLGTAPDQKAPESTQSPGARATGSRPPPVEPARAPVISHVLSGSLTLTFLTHT
jgi:hypothetical protein